MKRTLRLERETLGSLSDADLSGVVGGAMTRDGGGLTCDGLVTAVTCDCVVIGSFHHCIDLSRLPTCYCNTFPYC